MAVAFEKILSENGLRKTSARLFVLESLSNSDFALSHKDLEEYSPKDLDRVTLYRTLNSFEEKGLVHKVLDEEGTSHFAMCSHKCDHHDHNDNHIHFHCQSCKKIYCLDDFDVKGIEIPTGFNIINTDLKIDGLCKSCSL